MGQIISIILNFLFPKAETVVPAQHQPNLAVIDDEEPLLTENPVEDNLEGSFKTTSSEHTRLFQNARMSAESPVYVKN